MTTAQKLRKFSQSTFILLIASLATAGVYTMKLRPADANDVPPPTVLSSTPATQETREAQAEQPVEATPVTYTPASDPVIDTSKLPMLETLNEEFAALARAVMPSVVSITTSTRVSIEDHPFFGQFEELFGPMPREPRERTALGSGVIVSEEGHVITNYHVIRNVDEITVTFDDGSTAEAEVIAEDPLADLAVLRIEGNDLRPLPLGDSDALEVGEIVFAIGNPFMLHQTVTQGIISAKGRRGIAENISDFLQTNAEINPGNSGGPLVNWRGEVVGINTAIGSRTGAWQGVGFAIPSNIVRQALDSVSRHGRIMRGYLGVEIQELDEDLAQAFQLDNTDGALVANVMADSPAAEAGIERGDVIVKYDHRPVREFTDLRQMVTTTEVDDTVPIAVIRNGEEKILNATIRELPDSPRTAAARPAPDEEESLLKGVAIEEITPRIRRQLELGADAEGIVITRVDADSAAAGKLRPGDLIEEINRRPVADIDEYRAALEDLADATSVVLSINRGGNRLFVVVSAEDE